MPESLDLFPEHPAPKPASTLELVAMPGAKLSATQRAFKRWVAEIGSAEQRLIELAALLDQFRVLFTQKLEPLQSARDAINLELLRFLDARLARKGWTATEKKSMRDMIRKVAQLLFGSEYHDAAVELFDRHGKTTAAEMAEEDKREFAEHLGDFFGIEIDAETLAAGGAQDILKEALDRLEQGAADGGTRAGRPNRKTAERITKAEQQAIEGGKLLKDVYRRLSSAVHPDREPDTEERARKTQLMSEVNKAYAEQDLLKLLKLQLQAGKVDAHAAATMADEKLRVVNQMLGHQFRDLQDECREIEMTMRGEFHLNHAIRINGPDLQKSLLAKVAEERRINKQLRQDLIDIQGSEVVLRAWLKAQRNAAREAERFEAFFMGQAQPKKARRRR